MNLTERTVLDTVRIIETREVDHDSYEVCATARATYDESALKMRIVLDAFVRRFEMRGRDEILRPPWLPRSDTVETHVSLDEAPDAGKEIFSFWAQKVRKTIPSPSEWRPEAAWLHSFRKGKRPSITRVNGLGRFCSAVSDGSCGAHPK